MVEGQIRVSILNIPENISVLKLRGYLRSEAKDIQDGCQKNDLVLIKVFIPRKLKAQIPQRELDKIFQGIVDKMPNIYRVEFVETKEQLSQAELMVEAEEARERIEGIVEKLNSSDSQSPPPVIH